jgi:glucose-6-phosphate isomerase
VNVNAYHQPGVEAGKKAAASILELQQQIVQVLKDTNSPLSLQELASKAGSPDQIEAIYKIVRHLSVNDRGLSIQGNLGEPSSLAIAMNS